jgi:hypothetical protein
MNFVGYLFHWPYKSLKIAKWVLNYAFDLKKFPYRPLTGRLALAALCGGSQRREKTSFVIFWTGTPFEQKRFKNSYFGKKIQAVASIQ